MHPNRLTVYFIWQELWKELAVAGYLLGSISLLMLDLSMNLNATAVPLTVNMHLQPTGHDVDRP